jgi:hypothetical protein
MKRYPPPIDWRMVIVAALGVILLVIALLRLR